MRRWLKLVVILGALAAGGCAGQREMTVPLQDFQGVDDYIFWCVKHSLWREARAHLEAAIAADSTDAALYNNLAVVYERWGLDDEALWAYDKARQFAPHNETIRENYKRFLHDTGPDAELQEPERGRRPPWQERYPSTQRRGRRR